MAKLTKFHIRNIKRMLESAGIDTEVVDYEAIWDSSLSAEENYNKIRNVIAEIGDLEKKEERFFQEDEYEYLERKSTELEEQHFKQEWEKRIAEIKEKEVVELKPYFSDYYAHIDSFLKNEKVNGFICVGIGGIGKSFNLMLKLKESGIEFQTIKGHFTALSFYRFLYQNREKQHIIIDDIAKLIQDKDIISLLLGALDYDNRLVEWTSSSPLTADLPKCFIFSSKIFILANRFYSSDEFLNALKDRCIYFELNFSREQIIEMLYILAKKRNYPLELVDYIKELSENQVINLSLRLLDKLYPYYNTDNWKELTKQIIEIDEMLSLLLEIIKSSKPVKEQIQEFIEKTGLSRRTFFRYKAKILSLSAKVPSASSASSGTKR